MFVRPTQGGAYGKWLTEGFGLPRYQRALVVLALWCPSPWNATAFSKLVRRRVGPFFQASFPDRARIRILLDSEPLLHTSEATEALAEFGIEAMPGWPKYSPDLNPQENVWSWVERTLRREEKKADTFADFSRRVLRVAQRYPSADSLIPSMHRRVQEVLKSRGAMTRY